MTGVASDVCVATTAREAADRGFKTIMVSDGCTTLRERMHQASLDTFNAAFGWVRTADDIVLALSFPRGSASSLYAPGVDGLGWRYLAGGRGGRPR